MGDNIKNVKNIIDVNISLLYFLSNFLKEYDLITDDENDLHLLNATNNNYLIKVLLYIYTYVIDLSITSKQQHI